MNATVFVPLWVLLSVSLAAAGFRIFPRVSRALVSLTAAFVGAAALYGLTVYLISRTFLKGLG